MEYLLASVSIVNGLPLFGISNTGWLTNASQRPWKYDQYSVFGQSKLDSAPSLSIEFSGIDIFWKNLMNLP